MTTPLAWSYTSLSDFINCPRQFYEKRVIKSVKEDESEQMLYGNYVHKAFELRQQNGTPLPSDLAQHEAFMQVLARHEGQHFTEKKVALSRSVTPCSFFAKDVWWRGVIDYHKISNYVVSITDYKTGKVHRDFKQLKLFALWVFAEYPQVTVVNTQYYWTQTRTCTGEQYTRDQVRALWREFVPHLAQYKEAFQTDTWQPRPSGLCNGWCPVTACEFWKPKREKR